MRTEADAPADGLPQGRLSGRAAFAQALRAGLQAAARQGWAELLLSDADFVDWPLGEREVVQALQDWARAGRCFTMLALSYRELQRLHPRFVRWRQTWDHLIDCRLCHGSDPLSFPSVLWTPQWVMQRIDAQRHVVVCDASAERRVSLRQQLDEYRRDSTPGFPASVLGL
jgi:hypothetical protein